MLKSGDYTNYATTTIPIGYPDLSGGPIGTKVCSVKSTRVVLIDSRRRSTALLGGEPNSEVGRFSPREADGEAPSRGEVTEITASVCERYKNDSPYPPRMVIFPVV